MKQVMHLAWNKGSVANFTWPWPKPLDGSISLKFLLETRLQSKSFDTVDDLLVIRFKSYDLN